MKPAPPPRLSQIKYQAIAREKYIRKHQFSHRKAWKFQVQLNTLQSSLQTAGADSFPPSSQQDTEDSILPKHIKALAAQAHTV